MTGIGDRQYSIGDRSIPRDTYNNNNDESDNDNDGDGDNDGDAFGKSGNSIEHSLSRSSESSRTIRSRSLSRSRSRTKSVSRRSRTERGQAIAVKYDVIEEIRLRMFKQTFLCPAFCRHVSIIFIVLWSIACAVITTLWCMWFDFQVTATNEYDSDVESTCPNATDIPLDVWLNYNATQLFINQYNGTTQSTYHAPEGDSFGDNLTVSYRFLTAIITSYLLGALF